ncbi:hypothetical protein ACK56M_09935 [Pseudomonas sp. s4]|uniref:hypothetical protein n=1 Tax=Pseudomonas sp. s4 TaxID=353218 RepID=UPI00398D6484
MSKPTGGPAFPVPGLQHDDDFNGMNLRDYFAAKALQGLCADPNTANAKREDIVAECYELADAMLAARVKP